MRFNSFEFRSVMGRFATGITVVTYMEKDKIAGMTANAFMSVSIDPPLILISVRKEGSFVQSVREGDRYGISFLSHHHERISRHFGGKGEDGFQPALEDFDGFPVISDAVGNLVVFVRNIHEAGDHLLYVSEVENLRGSESGNPLLYFGGKYHFIEDPTAVMMSKSAL